MVYSSFKRRVSFASYSHLKFLYCVNLCFIGGALLVIFSHKLYFKKLFHMVCTLFFKRQFQEALLEIIDLVNI